MIIIIDILINTLSSARRENGPIYSFFHIYFVLANISYLIPCLAGTWGTRPRSRTLDLASMVLSCSKWVFQKKNYFNLPLLENQELMYFFRVTWKVTLTSTTGRTRARTPTPWPSRTPLLTRKEHIAWVLRLTFKKIKKGFNVLFQLIVRELDNMKTGCYLTVKGGKNRKFILYYIWRCWRWGGGFIRRKC